MSVKNTKQKCGRGQCQTPRIEESNTVEIKSEFAFDCDRHQSKQFNSTACLLAGHDDKLMLCMLLSFCFVLLDLTSQCADCFSIRSMERKNIHNKYQYRRTTHTHTDVNTEHISSFAMHVFFFNIYLCVPKEIIRWKTSGRNCNKNTLRWCGVAAVASVAILFLFFLSLFSHSLRFTAFICILLMKWE